MPLLGLGISGAVLWALQRQLQSLHLHDVADRLSRVPAGTLATACFLMVFSFAAAAAMDAQALRYLGRALSYRRIALASFIGSALGNSLGFAMLSGGSVRYRLYSAAGLSAGDVGKILTFNGVTYWTGILSLAGAVLLLQWPEQRLSFMLSAVQARFLGIAALALVAAYLLWSALGDKPVKLWRWQLPPPTLPTALGQVVLAVVEWMLSTGVLLILLPPDAGLGYGQFVAVFLIAQLVALVSHVPGGIGVFDAIVLLALPPSISHTAAVAALLVYRGIYYLLPLAVAAILWGLYELDQRGTAKVAWLRLDGADGNRPAAGGKT